MPSHTQVSAYISPDTRTALEEYVEAHGVKKGHLIEMSRTVGCVRIVVDAKEEAVRFYERLGLRAMAARSGALGDRPEPLPMYLHLSAVPVATPGNG